MYFIKASDDGCYDIKSTDANDKLPIASTVDFLQAVEIRDSLNKRKSNMACKCKPCRCIDCDCKEKGQ